MVRNLLWNLFHLEYLKWTTLQGYTSVIKASGFWSFLNVQQDNMRRLREFNFSINKRLFMLRMNGSDRVPYILNLS